MICDCNDDVRDADKDYHGNDDDQNDYDIYIMMQCLFVCHEK